jgi:hypothetical protein
MLLRISEALMGFEAIMAKPNAWLYCIFVLTECACLLMAHFVKRLHCTESLENMLKKLAVAYFNLSNGHVRDGGKQRGAWLSLSDLWAENLIRHIRNDNKNDNDVRWRRVGSFGVHTGIDGRTAFGDFVLLRNFDRHLPNRTMSQPRLESKTGTFILLTWECFD